MAKAAPFDGDLPQQMAEPDLAPRDSERDPLDAHLQMSYKTRTMSRADHIIAAEVLCTLDGVVRAVDKRAAKPKL